MPGGGTQKSVMFTIAQVIPICDKMEKPCYRSGAEPGQKKLVNLAFFWARCASFTKKWLQIMLLASFPTPKAVNKIDTVLCIMEPIVKQES